MPNIKVGTSTFDLSSGVLEGILDSIELMKNDGKEHGFLFCDSGDGIIPGPKCTGSLCEIKLKACEGDAKSVGNFHSHPIIMSFSMGDYINGIERAKQHPKNKYLLCVSLYDQGLRCKSVESIPPKDKTFLNLDTPKNRETIKPYFSPKVSINLDQIHSLLKGVAWEDLGTAETVPTLDEENLVIPEVAIPLDEGDVVVSKPPAVTSHEEDLAEAKEALAQVAKFSEEDIKAIHGSMCAAIIKHISKSGAGCIMTPDVLPLALNHYLTKYCATKIKGGPGGLKEWCDSITEKLPPGWPFIKE